MAILQDNMQPAAPQQMAPAEGGPVQGGGAQLPKPNPEIMSPIIQQHIPELENMRNMLDGKMGDAYDRVLTAGMKMLYSPGTADTIQDLIFDKGIPMSNKLGEGVANLLVMMDNQGNGTIPKEVLIPVGVALLFEATDYMFECGIEVTEDDLGKALELMINGVFIGYGIDPKKMDEVIDDMGKKLGFEDSGEGDVDQPAPAEAPAESPEDASFNEGFANEQAARAAL